ncbi:nonstructural protein [Blackfly microvirus SF02]|uniref:Nonstructural protein n=1 Tax=Blackfly microvirus SF02 TaxID=2576452 RepID=A0A4V1F5D0_9VIRU|nr:nonstructural protein [Blackfly microvirus SF02]
MILQSFTVFDSAAKAYLPPFFVRSRGEAIRSFTDACCDEKSQFARHLADYCLFSIGEYDDSSGIFVAENPVKVLGAWEIDADVVTPFRKENRA